MNPMVNLNMNLEKELEMERQGLRRTRRYIGDDRRVADAGWYQSKAAAASERRPNPGIGFRDVETKPRQEQSGSFLGRVFHLLRPRRQPVRSDC